MQADKLNVETPKNDDKPGPYDYFIFYVVVPSIILLVLLDPISLFKSGNG